MFISNEYPPETGYGGVGTYTRYMAEVFAKNGHDVHVICRVENNTGQTAEDVKNRIKSTLLRKHRTDSEEGQHRPVNLNDVIVHRISVGPYPLPTQKIYYPLRMLCYKTIPQALHRLAWAKSAWEEYKKLSESGHFDIIEYPDCGAEGYYFRYYLPCVVRLHTPWTVVRKLNKIHEHPLDRIFQSYLERFSIKKARKITSPSHSLAAYLKHRWGLGPVNVYPNPIRAKEFSALPRGDTWLYTGRIEHNKGVHILIQAYAQVSAQRQTPRLILVGRPYGRLPNGKLYGECIRKLIEEKRLQKKVTWVSGVPHDEIAGYLRGASVAFFPSYWENFPYTCLEAMAAGVPPVASDCGGYREMIENEISGRLFEAGDIKALVRVMNQLLNSPESLKEMGARARIRVKTTFESSIVYKQALELYESARKEQ